jgi:hypothetical protein
MYTLLIQTGKGRLVMPAVEDGVVWETEYRDAPGRLSFSCAFDKAEKFSEGNPVSFKMGGRKIFYGFVFTKTLEKSSGMIRVTAYDQIRYLKNKDTLVFRKKTASQIIRKIAKDYGLNLGPIAGTGKVIRSLVEDNKTLLDMIQDALDLTMDSRASLFILHDSFGKLTLKRAEDMRLDVLINHDTAQGFTYESSIDSDTYNRVKLMYLDEKKNKRKVYVAKSGANINRWGLLQYYAKLNNEKNGKKAAKAILGLKNRVTRTLSVNGAFGDIRVRAGTSIPVALDLGDVKQSGFLFVERATHNFTQGLHTMDLVLKGGKYFKE